MKKGKPSSLSEDNVGALNAIGFTWQISKHVPWLERYEELKKFKLQKGHCEVLQNYRDNPRLGTWVSTQRKQYRLLKENKRSLMTENRVQALEAIGFTWQMREHTWTKRYDELKQFKLQKGHCEVPQKYSGNPGLGMWVSTQRKQYSLLKERKSSFMTETRIEELNDIGFTWQIKEYSCVSWAERYEELKQFKLQK